MDAAWLEKRGYYGSLRKKYVDMGWLEQPAYRVYRRPRGSIRWEQVVISLQTLLELPVVVGGRTALELQGYAHHLANEPYEIHLHGQRSPPTWLHKLPLPVRFVFHGSGRLFSDDPASRGLGRLDGTHSRGEGSGGSRSRSRADVVSLPWGQWNWPLGLSSPERAVLEWLDELPDRESFRRVDEIMEGLANLSPRRLQDLLQDCRSVKVKRLFLFFADRHPHAWRKRIERKRIDLGRGKRLLVRGGKLDPTYGITVPENLDDLR